jgi:Na+/H+-dicarboxylate symporter
MILKMYGVEIDLNAMFILVVSIFTVSVGTPGIPGGAIALTAAIVGVFGVPAEAVAIIFGVLPIIDRTSTVSNVVGDIAVTTVVAENENLLDKNVYSKM